MKAFFITLMLVVVGAGLAIANAPASLIPLALDELEKRQLLAPNLPAIALTDLEGTVWQGQANQAVITIDGEAILLGVLSWEFEPLSLLDRTAVVHVKADAPEHHLQATVIASATDPITINNLEGRLPISLLEPWVPMLVKGDIVFVFDHIIADQQLLAIDGLLNAESIVWLGGNYEMPLGSYMMQIFLQDNQVHIDINDFNADLGMSGVLIINPVNGEYQLDAVLQARPELAPEVTASIAWFGKRNKQGDIVLKNRGRL